MPEIKETIHLKDLWDTRKAASIAENSLASVALSIQPSRRGLAHHEFRRRQYQLQVRAPRSRSPAKPCESSPSKAAAEISAPSPTLDLLFSISTAWNS